MSWLILACMCGQRELFWSDDGPASGRAVRQSCAQAGADQLFHNAMASS